MKSVLEDQNAPFVERGDFWTDTFSVIYNRDLSKGWVIG